MIPKIIHYCWFGRGELPTLALKCIDSWKQYLPDYELRLWNEENFDIYSNSYVLEAYQSRKFAFVTDYVRLYALLIFGGIYIDTDIEIFKNLDEFLQFPGFIGFENTTEIQTGIIGSEENNPWIKEQFNLYSGKHFRKENGSLDMTSNVALISMNMASKGLKMNNTFQVYNACMHFFPTEYFCPKTHTGIISITPNTYCIHHFAASWDTPRLKLKRWFFRRVIGPSITDFLVNSKKKFLNVIIDISAKK